MQNAPVPHTPDYLESLNPAQRQAVETTEGPVLVLAGAGTGKTRVLTTRLAYLLRTNRAFPGQILAVTFTNKAAQEMKHRVSTLLGGMPVEGWWLGTFHALAAKMLRRHAELVGLQPSFTILDQDDQVRLIKQLMEAENIDTKKWPAKLLADKISSWKDKGLAPSEVAPHEASDIANGKLLSIYHQYQQRLKTLNAADFGDLLLHMITIFKDPKNAEILADYHRRFKYILVDEYQDTNVAQYLWLRLLARGSGNICCVGDDDQSIYGWRGAEVDNILRFEKDFPGAVIVRLEENYRSTGHILAAANGVIGHNEGRLGKELFTSEGEGEKIKVRGLWDGEAEARWVGEEIEALQNKKYNLNDISVMVRTGFQMRAFEERFTKLGLPHRIVGGDRFYERKEIRDALAYLRIINQKDDDLALERIINVPKRGIGDAKLQQLHVHARTKNISLYDAICDLMQTSEFQPKVRTTLKNFIDDFERWRGLIGNTHHATLVGQVLDESGYTDMWRADKSPEAPGRVENLKEFVSGMEDFESLPAFLEHVSLVMEAQDNTLNSDQITIMTLHGAKGLEFKCVFLPGWEEQLFPLWFNLEPITNKELEEERRLAYVGITRARERCYISHVANRQRFGRWMSAIPSLFVDELPPEHVEIEADTGLYGNTGRSQHWDSSGFGERFAARRVIEEDDIDISRFAPAQNTSGYSRGDKVQHEKFGRGTIVNMDGHKLDIAFEKGGIKRVMDSFITKAD